jgi:hypothetical protein
VDAIEIAGKIETVRKPGIEYLTTIRLVFMVCRNRHTIATDDALTASIARQRHAERWVCQIWHTHLTRAAVRPAYVAEPSYFRTTESLTALDTDAGATQSGV